MTKVVNIFENNCDGSRSPELGSTTSSHCLMTKTFLNRNFNKKKRMTKSRKYINNFINNSFLTKRKRFHSKNFEGIKKCQLSRWFPTKNAFFVYFWRNMEVIYWASILCFSLPSFEVKLLKDSSRRR